MIDHSPILISRAYLKTMKYATKIGCCTRFHKTEFFTFVVNYLQIVTILWVMMVFTIGSTHLVACQDMRNI